MDFDKIYDASTKYKLNILSKSDIDDIIEKLNFNKNDVLFFLENSREIIYTENIRKYIILVDLADYDDFLSIKESFITREWFYEFIVKEYIIKKCVYLEYIFDIPKIKDFIDRVIGSFKMCLHNDYIYNRFYMTDDSFKYMGKYYDYKFDNVVCEDNYDISNEAIKLFNPKYINLEHCNISDDGIMNMTNLEDLRCPGNKNITDNGIKNLKLKMLSISYNSGITNDGVKKQIYLESFCPNENIEDDTFRYLINLTYLNLAYFSIDCKITNNALKFLPQLKELDLSSNSNITYDGLQYLSNLEILHLGFNETITDEDLCQMTQLKKITLSRNNVITDKSIIKLVNLEEIKMISNDNITSYAFDLLINLKKVFYRDCKHINENTGFFSHYDIVKI